MSRTVGSQVSETFEESDIWDLLLVPAPPRLTGSSVYSASGLGQTELPWLNIQPSLEVGLLIKAGV